MYHILRVYVYQMWSRQHQLLPEWKNKDFLQNHHQYYHYRHHHHHHHNQHYQSQGLNPWGSPMLAQLVLDLLKGCFHRPRGLDYHRRFQAWHYHFYQCWVFCYHRYIIRRLPLPQYPKAGYYLPACSYPDPQKRTLDHLLHYQFRWMGFPAGHFY